MQHSVRRARGIHPPFAQCLESGYNWPDAHSPPSYAAVSGFHRAWRLISGAAVPLLEAQNEVVLELL
jgi:hypothetical protein